MSESRLESVGGSQESMKWIEDPLESNFPTTFKRIFREKDKMSMASTSTGDAKPGGYDKDIYLDDGEDSDTDSEGVSGSEDEVSWIQWFCGAKGNEFFCEVDDDYIQDDFNLSGLSSQVPYYEHALNLILDAESPTIDAHTDEQKAKLDSAAEMLYGLIHVRYILASKGMNAMLEKYKNVAFGRCPKFHCSGQPCLPVGQSDNPHTSTVKIYCPKCEDVYYPLSKFQGKIDGAYFGTTFPHLFFMTYPHMKPVKSTSTYVPRIFGFKIHNNTR